MVTQLKIFRHNLQHICKSHKTYTHMPPCKRAASQRTTEQHLTSQLLNILQQYKIIVQKIFMRKNGWTLNLN